MIAPPWCPARAVRIDVAAGRALADHALPYFPPRREVHHDDERGTTMTDQPELPELPDHDGYPSGWLNTDEANRVGQHPFLAAFPAEWPHDSPWCTHPGCGAVSGDPIHFTPTGLLNVDVAERLAALQDVTTTLEGTYDSSEVAADAPLPLHLAYGHQVEVIEARCTTCGGPPQRLQSAAEPSDPGWQDRLTKAWRILAALEADALHDIASVSVRSGVGLDACRKHLRCLWSLEYVDLTNSDRAGRGRPTMMWRRTSEGTHALARARARVTS